MHQLTFADTCRALLALARLGVQTRFRMRGAYWRWRTETAFGTDPSRMPPRGERIRSIIEYGAWVHRMRSMMRR
jgi:hypothetical protein